MTIHKEGRTFLFITLVSLFLINWMIIYFFPEPRLVQNISIFVSILLYLFFLQFFRNPQRKIKSFPNGVLAPADGKIVVIEKTQENEYLKKECLQISIFMSIFNVHSNRSPLEGILKYFKYHEGKYLAAWHPKSSIANERTTFVIHNPHYGEILFRQIAGALAKRICWYIKEGELIKQGEEFGFIKFGSRVDIFLPLNVEVKVKLGEKVRSGQTILAEFKTNGQEIHF